MQETQRAGFIHQSNTGAQRYCFQIPVKALLCSVDRSGVNAMIQNDLSFCLIRSCDQTPGDTSKGSDFLSALTRRPIDRVKYGATATKDGAFLCVLTCKGLPHRLLSESLKLQMKYTVQTHTNSPPVHLFCTQVSIYVCKRIEKGLEGQKLYQRHSFPQKSEEVTKSGSRCQRRLQFDLKYIFTKRVYFFCN